MADYSVGQHLRERLQAVVNRAGDDMSVLITGGEQPHVGAVSLACPEPPRPGFTKPTASVSTISAHGHRDDDVSRYAAKALASALNCRVAVAAGIHIDNAGQDELAALLENVRALCLAIIAGEGG